MEEVEEGGSWKKLKKWSDGRSGRSGIMEEAQELRWKKLCRNIAWKIQE